MTGARQSVDVLVIGAGPAGMTAAIYSGRALLSTLVIERAIPGGQLNETDLIENWPGIEQAVSAPELMKTLHKQTERFGAQFVQDEVTRIEPAADLHRVVTPHGTYNARVIILACGSRPRLLPAEGADRLKGRGVSYCATCDGFFFRDKSIVEVGAGDSGLTSALYLTRYAREVAIVVRHPADDPKAVRGTGILRQRVEQNEKIRFLWSCVVEGIVGDDHVTGVRLRNLKTDEVTEFPTDGVFVNIGHDPQTAFLGGTVDLSRDGYIVTDTRFRTNIPGIFAAGDARVGAHQYAQAVIAAGEGAAAALEAESYLSV